MNEDENKSGPGPGRVHLCSLPVQAIRLEQGVVLRRGCHQVLVRGDHAPRLVMTVLEQTAPPGRALDELLAGYPEPDRPVVGELVGRLKSSRILVERGSGDDYGFGSRINQVHLANLLGDLGVTPESWARFAGRRIVILGLNYVSRELARSLWDAEVTNLELVDYPLLRNLAFAAEEGNGPGGLPEGLAVAPAGDDAAAFPVVDDPLLVVAACDFGGYHALRVVNKQCVSRRLPLLPVSIRNSVGLIGPLVIPGETACYECLGAREDSHNPQASIDRAVEQADFEGQSVTSFHPATAAVVAHVAALECLKYALRRESSLFRPGTRVELNLIGTVFRTRRVLKVPRCRVCSPLLAVPPTSLWGRRGPAGAAGAGA